MSPSHDDTIPPGIRERVYSTTSFPKQADLTDHALGLISSVAQHEEIIYQNTPQPWVPAALDYLDETEQQKTGR